MGKFLSFVKKETLHILRDSRMMLITLFMPVIQILLFGFAISTEVNNVNVAVVSTHPTEAIRQAVVRIQTNNYFTFKGYIQGDQIDHLLRSGVVDVVAVFASDYDKQLLAATQNTPTKPAIQIIADASNTNISTAATTYLRNVLKESTPTVAAPETRLLFNPQMKSAYNFVPGIMGLIFIIICSMMTSVSIVREKEVGTMEVLLVSPVRPLRIILAKMIPYFLLSCMNLASILLLARYVLDVPMSGSIIGIIVMSLLYIVLALALGLLISTMANKQVIALIISAMLMLMPMIMLSGMVFPIENMPSILQGVSCIIPARWYIDAMRKLMVEGLPFAAIINEFTILLGMTIVLIVISIKKFKDKLE